MGDLIVKKLNDNQKRFVYEYVNGENKGNATQCYAKVYNNSIVEENTSRHASQLIRKDYIKEEIKKATEDTIQAFEAYKVQNIEMLKNIAMEMAEGTPVDNNGNVLPVHQYRQTAIRAIGELNNMIGGHKPKEQKVEVDTAMQFVFNVITPSEQDSIETIDITPSEEDEF